MCVPLERSLHSRRNRFAGQASSVLEAQPAREAPQGGARCSARVVTGARDGFVRCLSGGVCGSSLPEIFEAPAEQTASQGNDGVGAGHGPAHAGALEPCADLLASGLDDARGDAQSPGAELRIAHPVAVAGSGRASRGRARGPADDHLHPLASREALLCDRPGISRMSRSPTRRSMDDAIVAASSPGNSST